MPVFTYTVMKKVTLFIFFSSFLLVASSCEGRRKKETEQCWKKYLSRHEHKDYCCAKRDHYNSSRIDDRCNQFWREARTEAKKIKACYNGPSEPEMAKGITAEKCSGLCWMDWKPEKNSYIHFIDPDPEKCYVLWAHANAKCDSLPYVDPSTLPMTSRLPVIREVTCLD